MGNKKAEAVASEAVVMTPKRRLSKSNIIGLMVGIAVIAGLVGAAVWYTDRDSQPQPKDAKAVIDSPKYQQANKDSDKLRASGSYDQAKTVWQEYVDGDYSEEEKYKAYIKLGSLDESKGDCKAALVNYYQAEKLTDRTFRVENESIARCAEKLSDWATAQTYYQKALDTFPGGEEYNGDRSYYQKKIEAMKQKAAGSSNG